MRLYALCWCLATFSGENLSLRGFTSITLCMTLPCHNQKALLVFGTLLIIRIRRFTSKYVIITQQFVSDMQPLQPLFTNICEQLPAEKDA